MRLMCGHVIDELEIANEFNLQEIAWYADARHTDEFTCNTPRNYKEIFSILLC